jgi:hypothetical protein
MPWIGAAIGAVGGLLASKKSSDAASDAANASADASAYSADIQKQMYDQTRQDQMPWRDTGANALSRMSFLMGLTGSQQDRNSLRSQYLPQYSTTTPGAQQTGLNAGILASLNQQIEELQSGENAFYNTGKIEQIRRAITSLENGQGSATDPTTTIDETGLNAAIDRSLSKQQTDPAFGSLSKSFGMQDFNTDPGYQFRMDQGINALQGRAAAGGGLKSGNTLKALMEYGQNLGSQEYGNAYNRFNTDQSTQFNRMASMAGIGQTANSALQSAGTNYANSVGNLSMNNAANQGNAMLAGANARASGYSAVGNALGNYFGNKQTQWQPMETIYNADGSSFQQRY